MPVIAGTESGQRQELGTRSVSHVGVRDPSHSAINTASGVCISKKLELEEDYELSHSDTRDFQVAS